MIWILLKTGNEKCRYIKAEPPCMKGEATLAFLGFVITVLWGNFKDTNSKLGCADCGAPYGEDGWCDVVIPDEIWNQIDNGAGILCFRCMTKRLIKAGFDCLNTVPVIVASGPYRDENEVWRLLGWEHGYKVGKAEGWVKAIGEG
jgi:DNA-directed RNA polymerase subunit RPC12/RpoP